MAKRDRKTVGKGSPGIDDWAAEEPALTPEEEALAREQVESRRHLQSNAELRRLCRYLERELAREKERADLLLQVRQTKMPAARIAMPRRRGPKNPITTVSCMSDAHVEERVDPATVNYRNEHTLEIADEKISHFFRNVLKLHKMAATAGDIRAHIGWFGGDLFTGHIHDELVEVTQLTPYESALWLMPRIKAGLRFWRAEMDCPIIVPWNYGNHGRDGKRPRISRAAEHNLDWLLGHLLAREMAKEEGIEFRVSAGYHLYVDVAGFKIRFHHGDWTSYYGGVGGITIPLNKKIDAWNKDIHADLDVLGHWHQTIDLPHIIVNGCFPAGTQVMVPGGVRPIEAIAEGDLVISGDGQPREVEAVTERSAPEGLIGLTVKGLPLPVRCTPNHLIWAIKGESTRKHGRVRRNWPSVIHEEPRWIPADFLSEGDWICAPTLAGDKAGDIDLLWTYGLFLAEGHTIVAGGSSKKHYRIEFSMHVKELPVLERAKQIMDSRLGVAGRTWVRRSRTASHLSYSGKEIAEKYRLEFGHLSYGKKVPAWMFSLDAPARRAVVEGWLDGDGHRGRQLTGATSSEHLAWGMFALAAGTGLEPMLYYGGQNRWKRSHWRVAFPHGGQDVRTVGRDRFLRIVGRNRIPGDIPVYDLQVAGNPSYVAGGAVVHNSMIGWNPYAIRIGAKYEPPQQGFFIVDMERRLKSGFFPVYVTKARRT